MPVPAVLAALAARSLPFIGEQLLSTGMFLGLEHLLGGEDGAGASRKARRSQAIQSRRKLKRGKTPRDLDLAAWLSSRREGLGGFPAGMDDEDYLLR